MPGARWPSPTYVLGQDFFADRTVSLKAAAFDDA